MSEKGGKGYTPLGGLKGKDDSTPKSAKGRKVHFSKEGPPGSRINNPLYGNGDFSKGGKGYTPLGGLKGKDDSTPKSAKGRKVHFSKEGPPGSRINNPLYGNGDFSKGGKADKVANGGKGAASKDSQQPEHRVDQELPKNIKCLMDCEAANILQGIQGNMVSLSRDPAIKMPISFDKGLLYAKSSSKHTNPESVRLILEPLLDHGLTESEICVIANVCPETADEVFALLPSLKGRRDINNQLLEDSLSELAKLRQPL